MTCTTHHNACDCREAHFSRSTSQAQQDAESVKALKEKVQELEGIIESQRGNLTEAENRILTLSTLLKEICEEWDEDCNPTCNSFGHDKDCKHIHIAAAKRAMREEIERLKRILAKELTGNADIGAEFVYVQVLKERVQELVEVLNRVVGMTRETPCLTDGVIQQCRDSIAAWEGKV